MVSLFGLVSGNELIANREKEIFNYIALGESNKQIAMIIGRTESTIKNHEKRNANDRTHAVTIALVNGWMDTDNICKALVSRERELKRELV